MRMKLLLRPFVVLLAFAVVDVARPQHRHLGRDQGYRAENSFLIVMFITNRGSICTCVALGQRSGYGRTKGATIPNTMIRLSFYQAIYLVLCRL